MANNRLELVGLPDLLEALRDLPGDLLAEADALIENRAEFAIAEIRQRYPIRTGNLRNGLGVRFTKRGYRIDREVYNRAPHAILFEVGTHGKIRYTTGKGKIRAGVSRGPMPPGRVFIPTMIRHRNALRAELMALLTRHGFVVTTDGAD